ncbi:MAG TPA: glucose-1-phosphate cytidylyltransferase [Methylomirabilota bacterium]|nr:glucose-1-phosphate cytidylyltransferase [Methylomirabilota bacterium]
MKVVLFCGGLGTRLREYSETIPKPMVTVGPRPIIWNVMKYYAYYGHTDFILCLGYRGDLIKNYFLNYDECLSNDFVLSKGGKEVRLYGRDIADWTITFADTGQQANIGQRLKAVEPFLDGEQMFLANYSDGLSDIPLDRYLDGFLKDRKVGAFACVRPNYSFHLVSLGEQGDVKGIASLTDAGLWINGGFFVFKKEIFDYIGPGEELVQEPFRRLIAADQLMAYRHEGFWACMDTLKDKQQFDDMHARGDRPWEVWRGADSSRSSLSEVSHAHRPGRGDGASASPRPVTPSGPSRAED